MTTAFVLSGGASLGAAQVGMALALSQAGVRPDFIVGTSVGAVNGGWLASSCDPGGVATLAGIWRQLRRQDVFPVHPGHGLSGLMGRRSSLFSNEGLRHLLEHNLGFRRLEDAPVPLHVTVTDVRSGTDACLSSGDAVDAILASAAIPGVFPPISLGLRDYMDGGVVNNTPITHAISLGADTVWVLSTGHACALGDSARGALTIALQALSLALNQRLAWDVQRYEQSHDVYVVPPLCPLHVSPADFSHGAELIERGRAATAAWLPQASCAHGQAALLEPHFHA